MAKVVVSSVLDAGVPRMITGGCPCGGVRFEFERASGPFEFCHCNRCRTVSGSAFMAGIRVLRHGHEPG